MITSDIQTALANEARRSELRQKIAKLQGNADSTASIMQRLSSLNSDTGIALAEAMGQLSALEAGAGPGITDDFGQKSSVTIMLEAERNAGMVAVVTLIKSDPTTTEEQGATAWNTAAIASHPEFPHVLQNAENIGLLYRVNLKANNLITDTTWASQVAWVTATNIDTILNM